MPELPEVEVTRLSFASRIVGSRILEVYQGKPLRWPLGIEPSALVGQQIHSVTRRGKYLLLHLAGSTAVLLLHLGMSGSLRFVPANSAKTRSKHEHFALYTDLGHLVLDDPRRFGAVVYAPSLDSPIAQKLLSNLGAEPLAPEFDVAALHKQLRQRKSSIKQVLLGGQVVVGVGNIYACESLFQAGISPLRPASSLSLKRCQRLYQAIHSVLSLALEQGGSSLRNFSNADGKVGYFQLQTKVYGREGQACSVCAKPIVRLLQGQRSTFYCPRCQK